MKTGIDTDSAIASLNDVVSELVCGLAAEEIPSRGWAYTAVKTLEEHTRTLGFEPNITAEQITEWEGIE